MKLSRSENTPPDPASQRMLWVPSVNPETSSPKTGTCRTCARENSWPYCPPEPMVFHVFQLQFTAYGGRSPGGRGPMERHSQPPELGRPHPGRIHSGITSPSRPSLECPSSGKTKEGHFLSTVLNGKQGRIFKSAEPRGASFRRRRTLLPYGLRWTGPAASHNDSNMNMSRKSAATPACA